MCREQQTNETHSGSGQPFAHGSHVTISRLSQLSPLCACAHSTPFAPAHWIVASEGSVTNLCAFSIRFARLKRISSVRTVLVTTDLDAPEMAPRWSARLARFLVALALVSSAGGVREPRARSRLESLREASNPHRTSRVRDVRVSSSSARANGLDTRDRTERGVAYSQTESERFVFLAGAAYCDAGLESWTCPYCNGTSLVDVRVTTGAKNMRGYVGWDRERDIAVVAFRGTEPNSLENWLENLDAHHTEWRLPPEPDSNVPPPPLRVHAGFLDSWRELRGETFAALREVRAARFKKNTPLPVVVTGHSLGGALATLCALELQASGYYAEDGYEHGEHGEYPDTPKKHRRERPDEMGKKKPPTRLKKRSEPPPPPPPVRARAEVVGVRTFGSPRVGDILFATAYASVLRDATWRVTHAHDVVPSVPTRLMGFHHVPTEVFYADENKSSVAAAPRVCDGGGEDLTCFDSEWTHTSVLDHLYYLDTYICGCNA